MKSSSFNVIEKVNLTPSSCFITLFIPKKSIRFFKYKAGQYVTVSIRDKNGIKHNRCYSICGSIKESNISICVKKVPNGIVSSFLFDELKIGDFLEISQAEGNFTLTDSNAFDKMNNVFISAGSGITPIKSQIENLLYNKYKGDVYLIFANNNKQDVIFYDFFKKMEVEHSNFHLILILKTIPSEWTGEKGILSTDKISFLFGNYNLPIEDSNFYICGPQGIVDNSKEYLKNRNVKNNRIFTEKFFTNVSEKLDKNKVFSAKIISNGKEYNVEVKGNQSILDATISNGIEVEYSCKNGVCLSCSCELTTGEVIAPENTKLLSLQSDKKIILPCQSYVKSNDVQINYDINLNKKYLQDKNKLIITGIIGLLLLTLFLLRPSNELFLAKGEYNIGHEELKCNDCHKDASGTTRQKIQRNVKSYFEAGVGLPKVHVGKLPVGNDACLHCHSRPNDVHPTYRFMEPKFKKARKAIHPENCVSCHAEHNKRRVTFKNTGYCINCHEDIKIDNDPLDLKHELLIKDKMWNTCIQCHDFHGNHEMKIPDKIKDTIPLLKVREYFKDGKDPYSKVKKYIANLDSIKNLK